MKKNNIAKVSVRINAPIKKVWDALTRPDLIKEYMFGSEAISEWKKGSPIIFRGEWEGKSYEDKGIILAIEPPTLFRYTYWSPLSGTTDHPDNYANVTYDLFEKNQQTVLTITQDGLETEESKNKMEENWQALLQNIKDKLEQTLAN